MNLPCPKLLQSQCSFETLIDLVSYRAQSQPEQTLYTFLKGGETEVDQLTFYELHCQAQKIAAYLQEITAIGERALLLYPPGLGFITAFLGCLYAGVVAVPAYPPRRNQNLSRLQAIVADAEPSVILTTGELLEELKKRSKDSLPLNNSHWIATDNLPDSLELLWKKPSLTKESLAFLQYTSGSTGAPKGVMVSHDNLLNNSSVIYQCFSHSDTSRGMIWLPPYHDMGLIGGILQPLYGGFPVVLMSPIDFLQKPFRWLQAISRYRATTSGGPNFAYELCIQKIKPEQRQTLDLSSWDLAFTGAEPIRAETLERFASTFASCGFRKEAFYPCYGMAETTLIAAGGLKSDLPVTHTVDSIALEQNRIKEVVKGRKSGRTLVGCGQSWLNHKILIVDPETQQLCQTNQVGEIWVSGVSVAQGYWKQPGVTKEVFNAYLADSNEGPFLRTGDLGFVYNGELFVTGRIKDVIIIRGQNHYPQDIESTVQKSHPALRANCGAAFSVEIKGLESLVVVQEIERTYLNKFNKKEILDSIRQAVTAHHGLNIFSIVLLKTGTIPKTSSGKIKRHVCRNQFLTNCLSGIGDWSEDPKSTTNFLDLQKEIDLVMNQFKSNH